MHWPKARACVADVAAEDRPLSDAEHRPGRRSHRRRKWYLTMVEGSVTSPAGVVAMSTISVLGDQPSVQASPAPTAVARTQAPRGRR